ncbi:hypothetical protein HDV03_005437 [Kappamyces sp. JEL0829]|nr:hypothetical protein HDV03_005437 [Kappamyces sp. JEL0829]
MSDKKKTVPAEKSKTGPIEGAAFIKHVFKRGGKNSGQLQLEDLDERVLQRKLDVLTKELDEYKHRKKENAWYRQEIEMAQKDNQEYIAYLESKKDEKLGAISKLAEGNKQDLEKFEMKRRMHEQEHQTKIAELADCIAELEVKLSSKEDEFLQLSDTMAKRTKHYQDLTKIREEIKSAELDHQDMLLKMEKNLLDMRMKLQKESEEKIKEMEAAAEEKAAKYLSDHSSAMERDNRRLERLLAQMTLKTQRLIEKKDQLLHENHELEREHRVRNDLVALRLSKIAQAEAREQKRKEGRRQKLARARQLFMSKAMAKGLDDALPSEQSQWLAISDNDD